jgi:hypothetical protein
MSRRFWIICLMLALVPLRGWAAASMPMASMAVELNAASTEAQASVPPCHQQTADASVTVCQACDLCSLCHGMLAQTVFSPLPAMGIPSAAPAASRTRDTGRRLIGGLDRPPRLFLA